MICNWTYGVPNELVKRAVKGGADADLFEHFARRNMNMISRAIDRQSPYVGAFGAFVIALLGTFAVRNGSEAAQGVLFILAPLAAMGAVAAWRLKRLEKQGATRQKLLKLFMSERTRTAVGAGVAMVAAYAFATLKHGPGWSEALLRGL
jgi:hypothetical protein